MWKEMLIVGAFVVAMAGLLSLDKHASAPPPHPPANMVAPLKVYGHGDTVDGAAYCVFGEVYLAANDGVMMQVLRGMAEPIRCEE